MIRMLFHICYMKHTKRRPRYLDTASELVDLIGRYSNRPDLERLLGHADER